MLLPQPLRPLSVYRNFYLILPLLLLGIRGILTASYSRTLTEILKDYDTLKKKQIRHRIVKRSASHGGMYEREIHFRSLGREFDLRMIPDHSIFSPDFKAVLIRKNDEVEVAVDKDSFLTGYVEGIVGSKVQAHLEDGILMANIDLMDDSYIVESSSRHIDGDHDFDMIVYRLSDVRSNLSNPNFHNSRKHPSFCGVKDPGKERNAEHLTQYTASENEETHSRNRRSTFSTIETYDTCNLALVADYLFYDHMGQGKTSTAINYMLSVIQRVDQIYRTITWPSGLRNIGLEVRKVILHSEPSSSSGPGYNQYKPKSWGEEDLLTAFSKGTWMDNDICLGHLFTYQDFADGVIGVAYVANAKAGTVGGICSPVYKNFKGEVAYLASGLSSSMNWGRRLLTSEADVVTAHELGHNFGSDHDPFTSECSPGESKGGKFIMHSTSVSGLKLNNKKFSPCSLRSIDKVLVAKRTSCFRSKVGQYCGNNEVEINKNDPSKSEDCDPGFDAKINDTDKCCSTNCKFKLGATCSDTNTPCCQNCRPASKLKKCRESFPLACQGETYCDGVSTNCPEAPKLSGVPCAYSKGKCVNGVCLPFCEQRGLVSCLCSKADDICKICCSKSNSTDSCEPIVVNGTTLNHNEGGPCDTGSYTGSCLKGSCKKTQKNVLDYFSNLLEDFTASKFARFMQENIVGTIMVFSLLVWVPASCIVHYVDKRREREVIERMEWESIQNSDLLHKQKEDRKKGVIKPKKSPRRLVVPS
ncbi:ADAM 17-like protease [Rhopilema esculentum]|uniref:ADAM 17-like protease n=1 Tax=Rhopilema esculentum TaxID=499914 RepID=UPI0031D17BFF